MDDPVSWLMIEPGWEVCASDGTEVGSVDEVAGDDVAHIFDGLAVAATAFGRPRYVPAERVARITDGTVHLALTHDAFAALGEYLEPATSSEIEPDDRGGLGESIGAEAREIEGRVLAPTQHREHSMNVWRRIYFFVRRLLARE